MLRRVAAASAASILCLAAIGFWSVLPPDPDAWSVALAAAISGLCLFDDEAKPEIRAVAGAIIAVAAGAAWYFHGVYNDSWLMGVLALIAVFVTWDAIDDLNEESDEDEDEKPKKVKREKR